MQYQATYNGAQYVGTSYPSEQYPAYPDAAQHAAYQQVVPGYPVPPPLPVQHATGSSVENMREARDILAGCVDAIRGAHENAGKKGGLIRAAVNLVGVGASKALGDGSKKFSDVTDALTRNGPKKARIAVDEIDEQLFKVHALVPELPAFHVANIEVPKGTSVAGLALPHNVGLGFGIAHAIARKKKMKRNQAELAEMLRDCKQSVAWLDVQIANRSRENRRQTQ